jgi:hypothetical protein
MEAIYSSETSVLKEPHCITSQKTAFFIVTAVKTSNITLNHCVESVPDLLLHTLQYYDFPFGTNTAKQVIFVQSFVSYG